MFHWFHFNFFSTYKTNVMECFLLFPMVDCFSILYNWNSFLHFLHLNFHLVIMLFLFILSYRINSIQSFHLPRYKNGNLFKIPFSLFGVCWYFPQSTWCCMFPQLVCYTRAWGTRIKLGMWATVGRRGL